MKNTLLILFISLFFSCNNDKEELAFDSVQDKYEYLEYLFQEKNLTTSYIEGVKSNPAFLQELETKTKEELEAMVENFAGMKESMDEETAFWNEMETNGQLEALNKALEEAKTDEDLEQIIQDFPEMTKRNGFQKNFAERKKMQQEDNQ